MIEIDAIDVLICLAVLVNIIGCILTASIFHGVGAAVAFLLLMFYYFNILNIRKGDDINEKEK